MVVERNAYGRQLEVSILRPNVKGVGKIPMTFIRGLLSVVLEKVQKF